MTAIKVENLSKRYLLGAGRASSIRDALAGVFRSPWRTKRDELWALNDVCFDVKEGETLGIIGRNGAGKSTLLKILSRITKPTRGRAEIRGRVGSLLEVGTGFHNELTGRENIYMNGAILGMKRTDIDKKFDEIVAFSELEKFLDTPVKHYSSGMYMRLAFSVAAHLEPEVLIVDEVLAVGDIQFQQKCLNKMSSVGSTGRTVLFVSHDLQAVTRICDRTIWLKDGTLKMDAAASATVSTYLHDLSTSGPEVRWSDLSSAPGNEFVKLSAIRVMDEAGNVASAFDVRKPVRVEMEYEVLRDGKVLVPNLHFFTEQRTYMFLTHNWNSEWRSKTRPKGSYKSSVIIPGDFLSEGWVYVGAALSSYKPLEVHFEEYDLVAFNMIETLGESPTRGDYAGRLPGIIRPNLEWETRRA